MLVMSLLRNNKLLWTLQILLALLYLFAGGLKVIAAPEDMRAAPTDPIPAGNWLAFLRVIGGFEVIAAGCLAIIMAGAVVVGMQQIGVSAAILPLVAGVLDLIVMQGRKNWGRG